MKRADGCSLFLWCYVEGGRGACTRVLRVNAGRNRIFFVAAVFFSGVFLADEVPLFRVPENGAGKRKVRRIYGSVVAWLCSDSRCIGVSVEGRRAEMMIVGPYARGRSTVGAPDQAGCSCCPFLRPIHLR